jgi:Mg2+ and Co2+ transporter CorA
MAVQTMTVTTMTGLTITVRVIIVLITSLWGMQFKLELSHLFFKSLKFEHSTMPG